MRAGEQPRRDCTAVLRRRPARIVQGWVVGGYTEDFEIVCCDCGDDPDLDYREVSPALQRIRGPYGLAAGVAAYAEHFEQHPQPRLVGLAPARQARAAGTR